MRESHRVQAGASGAVRPSLLLAALALAAALPVQPALAGPTAEGLAPDLSDRDGERIYLAACAACHGRDGTGASPALVGFAIPLPDFSDCSFGTREPDADWLAVVMDGGPARAFDPMMPAYAGVMTVAEAQRALDHVRSFCGEGSWPRGELNLPRPMFTEKAYPEDEAVLTTGFAVEGPGRIANELLYERRYGAAWQLEVAFPFSFAEEAGPEGAGTGHWRGGVGDLALGLKRALLHSRRRGSIVSVTGEIILPTGDESAGLGGGTFVFEPFLSWGQIVEPLGFLQFQGGAELPFDPGKAEREGFWRVAFGRTFETGRWGRAWTPMVEVLAARELAGGATTRWDLVPQFQVTLNRRQNVMANAAVRVPANDAAARHAQVYFYVLWDWFDGGLFEGW